MITLSRIILWLFLGGLIYYLLLRAFPTQPALNRVGIVVLLVVLFLAFLIPNDTVVQSLWSVLSFPLRPLGAAILLLFFATQSMDKGGMKAPGGSLALWSLIILLLASTPAIAYLVTRVPTAAAALPLPIPQAELVQSWNRPVVVTPALQTSTSSLAAATAALTETGDSIVYSTKLYEDVPQAIVALNPVDFGFMPGSREYYILQNVQDIPRRGLRLEDFVPSAQTLAVTTQVWDNYLGQVYGFLRGR